MREGAILDPTEAPTTTPTSEKTPARKPVLAPRSTEATTKMPINRSRTLRPAKSIYGFYIVSTLRLRGLVGTAPRRRLVSSLPFWPTPAAHEEPLPEAAGSYARGVAPKR